MFAAAVITLDVVLSVALIGARGGTLVWSAQVFEVPAGEVLGRPWHKGTITS